jgi:hypothetical protein
MSYNLQDKTFILLYVYWYKKKVLKSARWKACSMLDKSPAVCSKEIFNQARTKIPKSARRYKYW